MSEIFRDRAPLRWGQQGIPMGQIPTAPTKPL